LNVAVAVNWNVVVPCERQLTVVVGPIVIPVKAALVTVTVVESDCPDVAVAVIVTGELDAAIPCRTPGPNRLLEFPTVAMVGSEDFQPTELVIFSILLSEYVPIAVRFCFTPTGSGGTGLGVTAIETRVAGVTVTVVEPGGIPLRVAVICVFPSLRPVTSPIVGAVLLTCATVPSVGTQLTWVVQTGEVLLS
jgi:hypothetical protein